MRLRGHHVTAHHVGGNNQIQVARLGCKHLSLFISLDNSTRGALWTS